MSYFALISCVPSRCAHRLSRLKKLHQTVEHPPTMKLMSPSGVYANLPVRKPPPLPTIDKRLLARAFACSGHVILKPNNGTSITIVVRKQAKDASILFYFLECFGGSIGRARNGKGNTSPAVAWYLRGDPAYLAIAKLASYDEPKKPFLDLMLKYQHRSTLFERICIYKEASFWTRSFRKVLFLETGIQCMEELAQLYDLSGNISHSSVFRRVQLAFSHSNVFVLRSAAHLCSRCLHIDGKHLQSICSDSRGDCRWTISNVTAVTKICEALLSLKILLRRRELQRGHDFASRLAQG